MNHAKMKVLMIEHFLPESSYTLELGKALKNQTELTIFCRKGAAVSMNGIHWIDGFYQGGKSKLPAMISYLCGLEKLRREICKNHYDIVHVQSFKKASVEIPFYLKLKKREHFLVHTVHNLLPHEAVTADYERYRRFYHACDLLLVHNQHCKRLLMEQYQIAEARICVMPHGAYTMLETMNQQKKPETTKIHFLQFGIFRKYKGIDLLLEALALIPEEQRKRLHVTIAGAQFPKLDATDYEAQIKQLGLQELVTLRRGHIPDEELKVLFGKADFCLFPYRNIYGSGALLMAYSFGKPVLASDIPVFAEETDAGKTGLLFFSEKPEALKAAILEAADWSKKRYTACTEQIDRLVKQKYNWNHSAEILAEAYEKLWNTQAEKTQS